MTTARQLLDAVKRYSELKKCDVDPEKMLLEVPDEQFKMMLFTTAELFKKLRAEAERRGLWDEISKRKLSA